MKGSVLSTTYRLLRFGVFELNLDTEELRKDGTAVKLSPQPFRVLAVLASRADEIVTREEIRRQVWGDDTYVDFEQGLNQCIMQIRTALKDSSSRPLYIETLPRKGYRFLAPVTSKTIATQGRVTESSSGLQPRPELPLLPLDATAHRSGSGLADGDERKANASIEPAALVGEGISESVLALSLEEVRPQTASHADASSLFLVTKPSPEANGLPSGGSLALKQARIAKRGPKIAVFIVLASSLLMAIVALFYLQLHKNAHQAPSQTMSIVRLTDEGKTGSVAISPDGKYAAYSVERDGKASLWLRQIDTTSALQLMPDSDSDYEDPVFSPNGNFVYFNSFSKEEPNGTLYMMPMLGGTPRKVLSDIKGAVTFSPDGGQIAFVPGGYSQLVVANSDGTAQHVVAAGSVEKGKEELFTSNPSWSSDGRRIAVGFTKRNNGSSEFGISLVELDGKTTRLVSPRHVYQLQWLHDGSGLVFSRRVDSGYVSNQLFFIAYPSGEVSRITNDLSSYIGIGVTRDGSTLITVLATWRFNLMLEGSATQTPKHITKGGDDGAWLSVRGRKIAYSSTASGYSAIWVTDTSGSTPPVQVTPADQIAGSLSLSRDGKYLAYSASLKSKGQVRIWMVNSDGTNMRQLTNVTGFCPGFSDDGQWVYFQRSSEGKQLLFKVPVAGGDPVQVGELQIDLPQASHRGDRVVARYYDEKLGQWHLGVISLDDGKLLQVLDLSSNVNRMPKWVPADDGLIFVETHEQVSNLWKLSLADGERTQLTHFAGPDTLFGFDMDADGTLVFSRGHVDSDAILIRNFH